MLAGAAACAFPLASCLNRFEDHSAYDGVPFLCGDGSDPDAFDPELEQRIEGC
jgi:hypothetical protein